MQPRLIKLSAGDGVVERLRFSATFWTRIKLGKKTVSVQIGMNLTIVGSRELPK